MGIGRGTGDDRVATAIESAIKSPLLETDVKGAKAVLLNITGGYDLGMLEANEAAEQIAKAADPDAIIIFGATVREDIQDEIIITVIATGFNEDGKGRPAAPEAPKQEAAEETESEEASGTDEDTGIETREITIDDTLETGGGFEIPPFLKKWKE